MEERQGLEKHMESKYLWYMQSMGEIKILSVLSSAEKRERYNTILND
jgi:hypothetical protein